MCSHVSINLGTFHQFFDRFTLNKTRLAVLLFSRLFFLNSIFTYQKMFGTKKYENCNRKIVNTALDTPLNIKNGINCMVEYASSTLSSLLKMYTISGGNFTKKLLLFVSFRFRSNFSFIYSFQSPTGHLSLYVSQ